MDESQQDKVYLEKILHYLKIHKPEKANEKEAQRYLALMKGLAEKLVGEDLEFMELLLRAMSEAKAKSGYKKKPGRPKKRRISEIHKQAISEANKAHWAKRKAKSERQSGLKRTLSFLLDFLLWPI